VIRLRRLAGLVLACAGARDVVASDARGPAAPQANPAPASAPAAPVRLARVPRAGERLVHAFVLEHTLVAQRMTTRVGDVRQNSQDGIEISGRYALRFADELREVEGARAALFRRVLESAALKVEMKLQAQNAAPRTLTLDGTSPLVNAGVVFRRIAGEDAWGRIYDAQEVSEEFLPRLDPDLDLTAFLPPDPVAVGAAWSVPPERLGSVFAYGGLVPLRFGKNDDALLVRTAAVGLGGPLAEVFGGSITGQVEAKLRDVEGPLARIALELDVRAERDQTALHRAKLSPAERLDGVEMQSARLTWSFRGTGLLTWNVAEGRCGSLSLTGAETVALATDMTRPDGPVGSELELSGGLKLSIDVSAAAKR
jgi:hypothetical protein